MKFEWQKESLFGAMTSNGFKLGTVLSCGWFWMRPSGCIVLYRGLSIEQIDLDNILLATKTDAKSIAPPDYLPHEGSTTYFYVVRRANGCGNFEQTLAAAIKVAINADGELAEAEPNGILDAAIRQTDGRRILLTWYYCPIEQNSQPSCFNIYCDGGTGEIDYENPIAVMGYTGRKFYSFSTDALDAGRYAFVIRAEDSEENEDKSFAKLSIQVSQMSPDTIDILRINTYE
jgi:hypothetical protein